MTDKTSSEKKPAAERTRSRRHRAGSRRNKKTRSVGGFLSDSRRPS